MRMKEKLKNLDLKLTELASYLDISRPTLYKFLELYTIGEIGGLRKDVIDLFDFISNDEVLSKKQVLQYLFENSNNNREGPCIECSDSIRPELRRLLENAQDLSDSDLETVIQYINFIKRKDS